MEVKIQVVIDTYKEEIARLINENILLKAQIRQLQNELNSDEGSDE
mgnify:FL=1